MSECKAEQGSDRVTASCWDGAHMLIALTLPNTINPHPTHVQLCYSLNYKMPWFQHTSKTSMHPIWCGSLKLRNVCICCGAKTDLAGAWDEDPQPAIHPPANPDQSVPETVKVSVCLWCQSHWLSTRSMCSHDKGQSFRAVWEQCHGL